MLVAHSRSSRVGSNGQKRRQPRETTYIGARPSDRDYMKRALLASFAAFLLSSCSPSDQERANEKAREAGREMKREAEHASEQLKHGVEELDRKAGPKLDQAGREIKEESHRAAEKIKERADQHTGL